MFLSHNDIRRDQEVIFSRFHRYSVNTKMTLFKT